MSPALLVKLRPASPWRLAPSSGADNQVAPIFHSDSLFSAVTLAMQKLGILEPWLDATVNRPVPAVRFSSCFPFVQETLLIAPPRHVWPPPPSSRVRWKGARLAPLWFVLKLLQSPEARLREDQPWIVDGDSGCLFLAPAAERCIHPFRVGKRRQVALDRYSGAAGEAVIKACWEFAPGSGFWFLMVFADEASKIEWAEPLRGALRLLADSGIGGGRSRGLGRSEAPEFLEGEFPSVLIGDVDLANVTRAESESPNGQALEGPAPPVETAHWILSLFRPGPTEEIDWSRGAYSVVVRSGRIESLARSGAMKRSLRMLEEGSVLLGDAAPVGSVVNVAPDGWPHPVYRFGYALSLQVPWRGIA